MKYLLIIIFSFWMFKIFASNEKNMRRCMLLPVIDSAEGVISYGVFESVENYLKNSSWCYYRPNSDIINILKNYKKNIEVHLNNKEVRKLISDKANAGSVIKIEIKTVKDKIDVESSKLKTEVLMIIYGGNGKDVYYKEKTNLDTLDIEIISQTIKNWLTNFEKRIPYDAKVIGVLGNQFTIDAGSTYGILEGDKIDITRVVARKIHPLLKEIVEWKTEDIAKATIFHSRKSIAQGKVKEYESKKRLKIGDWIIHRKEISSRQKNALKQETYPEVKNYQFGKLGTFGISFLVGSGNLAISTEETEIKKMSGTLFGVKAEIELWATRNFWTSLEILKKFGTLSKDTGTFITKENNTDFGNYKAKFGYRYLPLGFFYGPRVDGFLGYAKYSYGMDPQSADGITAANFKGLLFGAQGNLPLIKDLRAWLELDFMVGSTYTEDIAVYGEDNSSTNYYIEFGTSYAFDPTMTFMFSVGHSSNKAKFDAVINEYAFKATTLNMGVFFKF